MSGRGTRRVSDMPALRHTRPTLPNLKSLQWGRCVQFGGGAMAYRRARWVDGGPVFSWLWPDGGTRRVSDMPALRHTRPTLPNLKSLQWGRCVQFGGGAMAYRRARWVDGGPVFSWLWPDGGTRRVSDMPALRHTRPTQRQHGYRHRKKVSCLHASHLPASPPGLFGLLLQQ